MIDLKELALYNLKDKDKKLTNKEAKRARFKLLRLLSKGHNIVVYISKSLACIKVFRKLIRRLILIDNYIR